MKFEYHENINFNKGEPAWVMFQDFWGVIKHFSKICKEDSEWEELNKVLGEFYKRNSDKDTATAIFALKLATAFSMTQEEMLKGLQGKPTILDELARPVKAFEIVVGDKTDNENTPTSSQNGSN
jgi:hypothetical protein